jgi:hypothetical protein
MLSPMSAPIRFGTEHFWAAIARDFAFANPGRLAEAYGQKSFPTAKAWASRVAKPRCGHLAPPTVAVGRGSPFQVDTLVGGLRPWA